MNASESPPGHRLRSRRMKVTIVGVAVAITASVTVATASFGSSSGAEDATPLTQVVPKPVSVRTTGNVAFDLDRGDAVYATGGSADAKAAAEFVAGLLRKPTGFALPVRTLTGRDRKSVV